jgi:hypothetical protein
MNDDHAGEVERAREHIRAALRDYMSRSIWDASGWWKKKHKQHGLNIDRHFEALEVGEQPSVKPSGLKRRAQCMKCQREMEFKGFILLNRNIFPTTCDECSQRMDAQIIDPDPVKRTKAPTSSNEEWEEPPPTAAPEDPSLSELAREIAEIKREPEPELFRDNEDPF